MKPRKLRVNRIKEVSLVTSPANQRSRVELLKGADEMKKADDDELEAALRELRGLVDAKYLGNGDPLVRDAVVTMVLRQNPALHSRIEAAARAVGIYKAAGGGVEVEIEKRAKKLMADDPKLTPALASAQVWKASPELRAQDRAAYVSGYAETGAPSYLQSAVLKKSVDAAVSELAEIMAPGDVKLGISLVRKQFPNLHAALKHG